MPSKIKHFTQIIIYTVQLTDIMSKNNHKSLFEFYLRSQKDYFGRLSKGIRGEESPAVRTGVSMCVHWVMKACHSSLLSQSSCREDCRLNSAGAVNAALLTSDSHTHIWHFVIQRMYTWQHVCHLDTPKTHEQQEEDWEGNAHKWQKELKAEKQRRRRTKRWQRGKDLKEGEWNPEDNTDHTDNAEYWE